MNLVLDIGNTNTKAGWFENDMLVETALFEEFTDHVLPKLLMKHEISAILVSSVGQTGREIFQTASISMPVLFLNHRLPMPLKISYASPETLGHDRMAAAAGAYSLFPGSPMLVMDLGTAITIDFVTDRGEYRGGNIAPGLSTRFASLHEHTARLPLFGKNPDFPVFGEDTKSAIEAGVQQGIVHELNGYITDFSATYDGCRFLLTGGDADFFADKLKKPIFVYPHLVLTGLNHILQYNRAQQRK